MLLVSTLLVPWWTYTGTDGRGDSVQLKLSAGTTYTWECQGGNCSLGTGSYTYSSTGLNATGGILEYVEDGVGFSEFVGVVCFLVALFAWVDRARFGAVRTATAAALFAALSTLVGPIWMAVELPTGLVADGKEFASSGFYGTTSSANWGPSTGWIVAIIAVVLFLAATVSEWSTLRYAKPWDAPLDDRPTKPPTGPPPVTTPPDRLARLDLLRRSGAITDDDVSAQRARILASENLVGPVPIPPNVGSKKAAFAHLEYLRTSGRYTPEQQEMQRANVLRVYGLSPSFQFPEEELQALVVRQRAGQIEPEEFERRKREILNRI